MYSFTELAIFCFVKKCIHLKQRECFSHLSSMMSSAGSSVQKAQETINSFLQLRWLTIDEISMACARLLAEIDEKLRSYHNSVDPFAFDAKKT